jgi:hypothetical protein
MSGIFPSATVEADGRFKVILPVAGKWDMKTEPLHVLGASPVGGFEFVLPETSDENGRGAPIDLGDITFQKKGQVNDAPPKPDDHGLVEIAFTLLDDRRRPLPDATAKVNALISATKSSSHYFYPKNIAAVHTDASGLARIKVPVTFREENGKDWPITGAELELNHDGYEPWRRNFPLGEHGAVLALKSAASVSVRVVKEGQPLPAAQVQMRVGWPHGWDCFEHRNWQASGDGVLRRGLVPSGIWQLQAAHLDAEKWRWFSEVAEVVAPGQKGPATFTLRRGTRVAGTLPAEVPRPVKRGIVRVVVRTPPHPTLRPRRFFGLTGSRWTKMGPSSFAVSRLATPGSRPPAKVGSPKPRRADASACRETSHGRTPSPCSGAQCPFTSTTPTPASPCP